MNHLELEQKVTEILTMEPARAVRAMKDLVTWFYGEGYRRGVDDNNRAWGREPGGQRLELEELPE